MMRRLAPLWLALAVGCASPSMMQRADTLSPGEVRLGAALVGGLAVDASNLAPSGNAEVEARVGVHEGVELGLRAFPIGGRADIKLRLHDADGLAIALDVGVDGSGFTYEGGPGEIDATLYRVGGRVALLTGVDVGASQIVVGLQAAPAVGSGRVRLPEPQRGTAESLGWVLDAGLLVAVDLALGDVFHLVPEIGVQLRFGEQRDLISLVNRDPAVLHAALGGYFQWSP